MPTGIFEAGMLLCFGFAWPVNIYKSIRSKTAKGKSLLFLFIIFLGYVFGITNKLLNNRDYVLVLYIINIIMVSIDIIFFLKNKKRDMLRDQEAGEIK